MILPRLALYALLIVVIASCGRRIQGEGAVTEKRHDLPEFTEIEIGGMYEVELTTGSSNPGVTVITNENIHEHIEIRVDNGELHIGSRDKYFDADELRLEIACDELEEIDVSGAVEMTSANTIRGNSLELEISGAGKASLDVNLDELFIDISGGAEIELTGTADRLDFEISGAGDVEAFDLRTDEAEVSITGAGEVELNVKKELDVSITGAGEVSYIGSPKVSESVTGAGEVKQVKR